MSYVVLARKWRPRTFEDLTGQGHVARTLTNAIERDRVPHALLFTGSRGVGKTSSARILAMALNCRSFDGPTTTPCGTCDSCREIQAGHAVDVLEIDGASNRGINEIRELRDGVRYAANRDRYKVYIIDEVHMLTTEAFNALLKTLEEPPKHVIFIFATTEAHKIPVTILSRVQRFDFRRIPYAEMLERLAFITEQEGLQIDREVLGMIARQASGGMRDSLSLLDQVIAFGGDSIDADTAAEILGAAERRKLFDLTGAIIAQDIDAALGVIDEVTSFGVSLSHFANEFVAHVRDLTVVAVSRSPERLTSLTDSEIALARQQTQRTDARTLQRIFQLSVECAESIARSAHAQLVFEMALVRMVALEPVHTVRHLIERLEALARGESLPEPPPSAPSGGAGPTTGASGGSPTRTASASGSNSERAHIEDESPSAPAWPAEAPHPASQPPASPDAVASSPASEGDTAAGTSSTDSDARPLVAGELPSSESPVGDTDAIAASGADDSLPLPAETSDSAWEVRPGATETKAAESQTEAHQTEAKPSEASHTEAGPLEAPQAGEPTTAPHTGEVRASAAPTSAQPSVDETVSAPTEPSEPPRGSEPAPPPASPATTLSNEAWREVVRTMGERDARLSALFSDAYVLGRDPGALEIGIEDVLVDRASEADMSMLEELILSVTGARIRVRTCPTSEIDPESLASAYRVQEEEAQERAAYQSRIIDYVTNHPSTRFILNAWPGSKMRIRVSDMTSENTP